MKTKIAVLFLMLPFCSIGQEEVQLRKEITEKVIAARKESESLLPKYSWISRTEVLKGKEVLNMVIERNKVGADGRIISMILNEQGAKMPTAFLIRDIAEQEKSTIEKFLFGLRDFLKGYSLHDTNLLVRFIERAEFEKADSMKEYYFTGKNVLQSDDLMRWWIDDLLYSTSKTEVRTTYEGDEIHFTATFITLRNGLNYMGYAEVLIPARNMVLQIQNYDYTPE